MILYPERLLRLLRTIEAAIGTEQGASLGYLLECIPLLEGKGMQCAEGAAGLAPNATAVAAQSCRVRGAWNGMCALLWHRLNLVAVGPMSRQRAPARLLADVLYAGHRLRSLCALLS